MSVMCGKIIILRPTFWIKSMAAAIASILFRWLLLFTLSQLNITLCINCLFIKRYLPPNRKIFSSLQIPIAPSRCAMACQGCGAAFLVSQTKIKKSHKHAFSSNLRDSHFYIFMRYTIPCAVIASATFRKPAIFAPAT